MAKLDTIGSHLVYSGLINHGGAGIAVTLDSFGNAYVAGRPGTDLPTTPDALQPQGGDAYFGVIDPSGNILYLSYFTGAYIQAIAVDPSGNVLLAGSAYSTISLKDPIQPLRTSTGDGFVAKISLPQGPQGLLFSSYLGGGTLVTGIASTSTGIVIAGETGDTSFPITSDAAQSQGARGFVAKISDSGSCAFGAALANSQPVSGSGGTATINVTAATGCHWTANSDNPSILTIASGSSGTSNGTVTVSVAPSSLVASRTSNVTVAGQVVCDLKRRRRLTRDAKPLTSGVWVSGKVGSVRYHDSDAAPFVPYTNCPECGADAYVMEEECCALCGESAEHTCARCGSSIPAEEMASSPYCGYCEHMMNKDD